MDKQIKADIVIVGAGVAGLVLGIQLAYLNIDVHIIEKYEPPAFDDIQPSGRTVALFGRSVDMIQACDVWDRIAPYSHTMDGLRIVDGDTDVLFQAKNIGHERFGYNVPNMILRSALYEKATKLKNITIYAGVSGESMDHHHTHVTIALDNGIILSTPLLVGADGRHSFVRQACDISKKETDYGQRALTFLIEHDKPHNSISTEFHKPGGPLALVPLPHDMSSVVWVESSDDSEQILRLSKHDLAQRLETLTNGTLGPCDIKSAVQSWDLKMIVAQSMIAQRTVLIAEAAHVMPPISAQGLNLSLRDVRDLVSLIKHYKQTGLDSGSSTMLQKYAGMRAPDITKRTRGVHALNSIVMHNDGFTGKAKRFGLKAVNANAIMKRTLMQELLV